MAKILIFGGSYDPVHVGHLQTARYALEKLPADRVLFIPTYESPHKLSANQASAAATPRQRLAMLQLAIADDPSMEVSDIELPRPPPSYTIDTLRVLQNQRPHDRFTLLIGSDQLPGLHTWRDIATIIETTPIAVLPRPGYPAPAKSPGNISEHLWNRVCAGILDIPMFNVSATDIRARLAQGLSTVTLLPPAVMEYIQQHRLYGVS